MSMDQSFNVSTIRDALALLDGIQTVNVSKQRGSQDTFIFEAHYRGDAPDADTRAEIQNILDAYGPRIEDKETADGQPYCHIEVAGLFDDR